MLEALSDAHRDRWSLNEELLKTIAELIDGLRRDYWATHGAKPAEPLKIRRPGEQAPKKDMRATVRRALAGLKGG